MPNNLLSDGIFRIKKGAGISPIHRFDRNHVPSICLLSKGLLYGITRIGGQHNVGTVFRVTSDSFESVDFNETNGAGPCGLTEHPVEGVIGACRGGGTTGKGVIFHFFSDLSVIYDFSHSSSKDYVLAPPVFANDLTVLYGTARSRDRFDAEHVKSQEACAGIAYRLDLLNGNFTIIHGFDRSAEFSPISTLLPLGESVLIGAAFGGKYMKGVIYLLSHNGDYEVIHHFRGEDGMFPVHMFKANDGYIYGVASRGGLRNCGVIFRLSAKAPQTCQVIYHLTKNDGSHPRWLARCEDGTFIGVAMKDGFWTVFSLGTDYALQALCVSKCLPSVVMGANDEVFVAVADPVEDQSFPP